MKNIVIAGDYKGQTLYTTPRGDLYIGNGISGGVHVCKDTVSRYELTTHESTSGFSVGKAAMGAIAFGDVGSVAGIGGKKKDAYRVALYFRDGKQSLVEMDAKHYKALEAELFGAENYTPSPALASKPKKKGKGSVLLSILIFVIALVICVAIAGAIFPVVDGEVQLNFAGVMLIIGVPILAAIFIPRLFIRRK